MECDSKFNIQYSRLHRMVEVPFQRSLHGLPSRFKIPSEWRRAYSSEDLNDPASRLHRTVESLFKRSLHDPPSRFRQNGGESIFRRSLNGLPSLKWAPGEHSHQKCSLDTPHWPDSGAGSLRESETLGAQSFQGRHLCALRLRESMSFSVTLSEPGVKPKPMPASTSMPRNLGLERSIVAQIS